MALQNNILFGAPFDGDRYAKVIKQCALDRDISLFDAGDQTEVGEGGITLRLVYAHCRGCMLLTSIQRRSEGPCHTRSCCLLIRGYSPA